MKTPSFPQEIKKGNSTVKIYRHSNAGYDEFKVSYYADGRRKMETFADYEDARERAGEINDSVNDGNELSVLTLTGEDRLIFTRATEAVRWCGVPLDVVAARYAESLRILADGCSVVEAARFCAKRNALAIPEKTVAVAVKEFTNAKTAAKGSQRHLEDLRYRLYLRTCADPPAQPRA